MSDPDDPMHAPRRMPRQNVLLAAEISGFGGGVPTKHRIRDLSGSGARIDRAGSLKVGSTVLVSVGVLEEVGATVMWVKDDSAGLRFAEPIDPDAARSKTIVAAKKPAPAAPLAGGWPPAPKDPFRR